MPFLAGFITPQDYGAVGNGSTDDTAAIQAAINAVQAQGGGTLFFPSATYAVTPVSSTSAALVLNNGTTGYQGVRLTGSSEQGATLKRLANGPIITMSGPSSDTTGVTHCRYCTIENLDLNGNNLTGTLVQTYYADTLLFKNVHYVNSNDVGHDCAEFWDSRFENVLWDTVGSTTANTTAPALWLRNTAASSGFGYSAGTTNNIYFFGCRWEQYKTGAVRIERGVGTNSGQPYSLYFVSSKLETANLNGLATFFCDTTARDVHVINCHAYVGGFYTGYSTAQDVFTFGPQFGSLRNILVFNASASACIANGVTLNAPLANSYVVAESVRGSYTGGANPTGAHISFGTSTGEFRVVDCQSDNGTQFGGTPQTNATELNLTSGTANGTVGISNATAVTGNTNADLALVEASATSRTIGTRVTGDTFNRWVVLPDGTLQWGSGTGAIDASMSRTGAGALFLSANMTTNGTHGFNSTIGVTGIASMNGGTNSSGSAPVLTPAFTTGTAAQLSDTTRDYMVYLNCTTSGTATTIAIGPANTTVNTLVASASFTAGTLYSFRLPAGWWVKWTGTTTAFAQKAIGC